MKLTDFFRTQLEAEAPRTARVLERVPEGRDDWKPHDKSMPMAGSSSSSPACRSGST